MGRLTKYVIDGYLVEDFNYDSVLGMNDNDYLLFCDVVDKLAHYEAMEEQGRLVEVRYGEWKPVLFDSVCSVCGYSETAPLMIMRRDFKYCPSCGAKMLKELEGVKE